MNIRPLTLALSAQLCSLFFALPAVTAAQPPAHSARRSQATLTTEQLCRIAMPAVVEIKVRDNTGEIVKTGSGFVIGENLVATNWHVVQDAHKVSASFHDGRSEEVYGIVGSDRADDVVIVWVRTGSVNPLPLADLSQVHIGEDVVAIGCPKGLENTVSKGIVSSLRADGSFHVIQTDAPISHGSSGGPLLNMRGEVLGVTSFGIADGQNLNFAIPSDYIKRIIPDPIRQYLPWNMDIWIPVSDHVTCEGRLGIVTADSSVITGRHRQVLSQVPRGTNLIVQGETDTFYAVVMSDKSMGFIAKSDVQLQNYAVYNKPPLPIGKSKRKTIRHRP